MDPLVPYDPPVSRRSGSRSRAGSLGSARSDHRFTARGGVRQRHSEPDSDSDNDIPTGNLVDLGELHKTSNSRPSSQQRSRASASFHSVPDSDISQSDAKSDFQSTRAVRGQEPPTKEKNKREADVDEKIDLANSRSGRMSKGWETPGTKHTQEAEQILAQIYDLTHAIDEFNNEIDQIHGLRKKISKISPEEDIEQQSIQASFSTVTGLVTQAGRRMVSLEQWLTSLHDIVWKARKDAKKNGTLTKKEVGELKFQLSSAKLDFSDALFRIYEGAEREKERRIRNRLWMARHIRAREPDMTDAEVKKLLIAGEDGAEDGVANLDLTSYAGIWAVNNPYTELNAIGDTCSWRYDGIDDEVVGKMTGKKRSQKKAAAPPPYSDVVKSKREEYLTREIAGAEKDIEYGYGQMNQLSRSNVRKKLTIALLVVVIVGLIILVWLASIQVPTPLRGSTATSTEARASILPTYETAAPVYEPTEQPSILPISESLSESLSASSAGYTSGSASESSSLSASSTQSKIDWWASYPTTQSAEPSSTYGWGNTEGASPTIILTPVEATPTTVAPTTMVWWTPEWRITQQQQMSSMLSGNQVQNVAQPGHEIAPGSVESGAPVSQTPVVAWKRFRRWN